jgi:hypothetical protein
VRDLRLGLTSCAWSYQFSSVRDARVTPAQAKRQTERNRQEQPEQVIDVDAKKHQRRHARHDQASPSFFAR